MKITFLDLETTDLSATCEILTACCRTMEGEHCQVDNIYLTFKPEVYKKESEQYHGISLQQALTFSNKWESFQRLLMYLQKHSDGIYCVHANHVNTWGKGYFDYQVIMMQTVSRSILYNSLTYYWFLKSIKKENFISTHTIAKRLFSFEKNNLKFIANYFGMEFKHHDVQSDVNALVFIFYKMIKNYNGDLLKVGRYDNEFQIDSNFIFDRYSGKGMEF